MQKLRREEGERDPVEHAEALLQDALVNRVLDELRLQHAEAVRHERQHERGDERADVRPQVLQEPTRETQVVRLADGLFFVILGNRR